MSISINMYKLPNERRQKKTNGGAKPQLTSKARGKLHFWAAFTRFDRGQTKAWLELDLNVEVTRKFVSEAAGCFPSQRWTRMLDTSGLGRAGFTFIHPARDFRARSIPNAQCIPALAELRLTGGGRKKNISAGLPDGRFHGQIGLLLTAAGRLGRKNF